MFFTVDHSQIEPLKNIAIDLGPIQIAWYSIFILSGALLAMYLGIREGKRLGISSDFIIDLVLYGIPISVVGARIYYVIFEWSNYKNDLISVLYIHEGGLAIHGAFITAIIWGYFFAKHNNVNFLKLLDLGAVGFLIAQAIGRWGNFMNQEAHGGVVPGVTLDEQRAFLDQTLHLPKFITNQMYIDGAYYHPTFLYESIWNIIGFTILLILRRTKLPWIGDQILFYLIWYSTGRFFIEGMRTDSLYVGSLRMAQLISIVFILIGLGLFITRRIIKWKPERYIDALIDKDDDLETQINE